VARLIRVVVIDDHPVFAQGLHEILGRLAGIEPVGYAYNLKRAVSLVEAERPDVVLCDVLFGEETSGFELPARLRAGPAARTPVVFLSQLASQALFARAVTAGGSGYLLKTAEADEIRAALVTVAAGNTAFPKAVLQPVSGEPRAPSTRETEILRLVAEGRSNSEVGALLGISDKTVETHLSRLFQRYGANSRTEMAIMADRKGWLRKSDDMRPT
jgi:DNA-binding NarL/FixJ family response regulator